MNRLLSVLVLALLSAALNAQSPAPAATSPWESADWGKLPAGLAWEAASQVSTTPEGQIVVLRRANPFFVVLTPAGDVVRTWGENLFRVAHGLRIDQKGFLWVTDNADNFVQKYSPDGKLLLTLGQRGVAGGNDSKTAFDGPADVFVTPSGEILVADGYRNSRIVRFSSDGTFHGIIGGTKGSGPGEFNVPHAVVVDSRGRIIVADAENSRIQVFDQSGKFVEQWTDFPSKPRGSMFITADDTLYVSHVDSESITIMKNGKVLERVTGIGGRPHGVTLDRQGNLYVANPASRSVKKIVKKSAQASAAPSAQQAAQPPPPTPDAFVAQQGLFKVDSMEFTIAPKEGMEYKYRLDKGAGMLFSWTATAAVHVELHSEPEAGPKGYAETFDKHDSRDAGHGNYVAPFAGIHGWYWENRTDRDVVVRIVSAGHYTESLEFRRKQDVKRKAFN